MGIASVLQHYISMGKSLDSECQNELRIALEELENIIYKLQKDVKTIKSGVEPLEQALKSKECELHFFKSELHSFKSRLFDCFDIGVDQTTLAIDSEKILELFGEEAYNYLTDI